MKQKIIWLIDGLGHGGAEQMTLAILQRMNTDRFDFRVCALQVKQGNPVAEELERAGVPVDLLSVPNLRHPANLPKLMRYLRGHKPALLHTQLEFANILGSLAGRSLGIPVVNTLHTHESPRQGSAYWRNRLSAFCLNHFSSQVVAVSEDTRQFHIRNNNIRPEKIITIYNGTDLSRFQPTMSGETVISRESLGISPESIVFITVAVLREPKGIQYMLEAIPAILRQVPNFQYLIVGDGDHAPTLRHLAASLNIAKQVVFAGQRSDIPQLLAICDVFVLPSLTEALPTVLIEAMASQKPIIATRVGGTPEMVTDQVNGLLVSPGQPAELEIACIDIAQNPEMRARMAREGYRLACERFDINVQITHLLDLYSKLISQKGNF